MFFVQKRSPIYFTIINLRSNFDFLVVGLEDLVLKKDCEIKDELVVNSLPLERDFADKQFLENLEEKQENRRIVDKNLKNDEGCTKIKKSKVLIHDLNDEVDFEPFFEEKHETKKKKNLCFSLLDRRKLSKSIRQIDASLLKNVIKIIGEFGSYENNILDINFDTLPTAICKELSRYIKNNKKTDEKKTSKEKTPAKPSEKPLNLQRIEEDSSICRINISSYDEKVLPNIKDST